jgi:hypothetical protein
MSEQLAMPLIVALVLIAAVAGYAWWSERARRQAAEQAMGAWL